jgi:SAM-dependent methyltransferase
MGHRGGWAHRLGVGVAVPIVRCTGCGLVYPNPMPFPRDFSHYSSPDEYFATGDKVEGYGAIVAEAAERRGVPGRMLDIGCGRGESVAAATSKGWSAVGVEPSAEFAAEGRRRYGVEIVEGLIEDVDLPEASFDLVMLSAVLEHVYDPVGLLRQAHRFLARDGLLYVDVPNERSLYHRAARVYFRLRGRDWSPALSPTFPPYHVVGFSPRSLPAALARAGLRPISSRTYSIDFAAVAGAPRLLARGARAVDAAAARAGAGAGIVCWATPVN